jgi:hypothetical protein
LRYKIIGAPKKFDHACPSREAVPVKGEKKPDRFSNMFLSIPYSEGHFVTQNSVADLEGSDLVTHFLNDPGELLT